MSVNVQLLKPLKKRGFIPEFSQTSDKGESMGSLVTENNVTTEGLPVVEIKSKEQAKLLHAQLNKFYRKERKPKAKPVLKPIGKVVTYERIITVQETPIDWDDIEDELFSLDTNATQIYVKTGKERARCLNNGKSISVGGAVVYRVFL
jgi:ribosomal protein S8